MVVFDGSQIVFAIVGGVILGIATSLNYITRGKVTGMSGIVYGIISLDKSQLPEKISIVGGMFFISSIFFLIFGYESYSGFQPFGPQDKIAYFTTFPGFALSGFLVGFGTKLSNGCTSGHGLCGISRFSIRSVVAVCVFLFTAIGMSTFCMEVGLGPFVNDDSLSPQISYNHEVGSIILIIIGLGLPVVGYYVAKKSSQGFDSQKQVKDQIIVYIVGILFGIGLMVSGMSRRQNILEFLQINENWNPALLFVLTFGLLVNVFTFSYMRKKQYCLMGNRVFDPNNSKIDFQLVGGAFCFGLGWGIGGLCPGPFLVLFSIFTVPIQIIWGISLMIGMYLANRVGEYLKKKEGEEKVGLI